MRKPENPVHENKRDEIIENFVEKGIFKINGKQLYELSLYELMKQYTMRQSEWGDLFEREAGKCTA